jgi:hypothetical protein
MIVIYTFDFKIHVESRNKEYMMLGISIQSVIESDPTATILLYTSEDELRRRIKKDFPTVEIRFRQKQSYCETKFFTCAGHARIATIHEVLKEKEDDVLYLDNDTIIYPDGIANFVAEKSPMGYASEDWNLIGGWFGNNDCYRNETSKIYGADMLQKAIINNGVQYFPYTPESLEVAREIEELYKYLLTTCGYYYGLDMAVFSIVMHDHGLAQNLSFKDQVTTTAWHAYLFKYKYLENIKKLGTSVDADGSIHGHENMYEKMKKAYR